MSGDSSARSEANQRELARTLSLIEQLKQEVLRQGVHAEVLIKWPVQEGTIRGVEAQIVRKFR